MKLSDREYMETVKVELLKKVDNSYRITIGKGLFPQIVKYIADSNYGKVAVITDTNVSKLYGKKLLSILKAKKVPAELFSFRAGEASKTREVKAKIEDALTLKGFKRDCVVIALGGGVVGDLAGFVASTYMRGVPFIQIPTTLLAMVDSSTGGKTGIDTAYGKNLIGAFYQPETVFIDVELLKSLDRKEMLNGIIEMVKHGIIADKKYFLFMRDNIDRIYKLEEKILIKAIKRSCQIKKEVVEKDEKEKNIRKMLNLGHTIGHAIEKASGYKFSHGISVGMGLVVETKIAERLNMISSIESQRIIDLLTKLDIKIKFSDVDIRDIVKNTLFDKKNTAGKTNYVLPLKVGKVAIDVSVKEKIIFEVLQQST
ncbi:MAG: 3-dehydroquinate synthase [Candidatus Omnitrophica bacterium]|nr:3-dehydroquinate synthase [Candidatus Omnitrophota bacterium]